MQMYFLYQGRTEKKVEKLTNTCEKTPRGWYSRVTTETMKNVSNTYDKISRGRNDTSHKCFFSQVPDVAKETKFIVSVNEFADEELEARKLGYLCCY